MPTKQNARSTLATDYITALPAGRSWRRIALVAAGAPPEEAITAACNVARRDGAQLVIYDAAAVSWSTSPYPPGTDDWLPNLLGESAMRRVGRDDLAGLARRLAEEGLLGGVYLSPKMDASDLADVVQREAIDLVISLLASGDTRMRHVHRARRSAHVLLSPEGEEPRLLGPVGPDDDLTVRRGIQWPYLLVVLATFILARLRNSR